MRRVAILGGRFDPPHWGHFWAAQQVLESDLEIDRVLLIPTNIHPWKKSLATTKQRLEMTKLLVSKKIKKAAVLDTEIKRRKVSFSIDTIKQLKKEKNNKYYWIIGSDALPSFSKWKNANELLKETKFIVFPRVGFFFEDLPNGFIKIDSSNLIITNLSSSIIRERVKKGLSIDGLVPKEIQDYILEHKLYI